MKGHSWLEYNGYQIRVIGSDWSQGQSYAIYVDRNVVNRSWLATFNKLEEAKDFIDAI